MESAKAEMASSLNVFLGCSRFGSISESRRVRPYGMTYQIVAGERRWRAANLLGLEEVPVIIKEFSDKETMQIALIENLVREDLTPLEEAAGFRDLMDQFDMTQEAVSKSIGRSRSAVANALRLLQLP